MMSLKPDINLTFRVTDGHDASISARSRNTFFAMMRAESPMPPSIELASRSQIGARSPSLGFAELQALGSRHRHHQFGDRAC
jgi:hypothetical protein